MDRRKRIAVDLPLEQYSAVKTAALCAGVSYGQVLHWMAGPQIARLVQDQPSARETRERIGRLRRRYEALDGLGLPAVGR